MASFNKPRRRRRAIRLACLVLFAPVLAWVQSAGSHSTCSAPAGEAATLSCAYSSLWGVAGERWKPAGSLIRHLYGDLMPPGADLVGTPKVVRFLSRVKSVAGNRIELERPLPYDVRAEWTPEVHRFVPSVQEVGVEHLSLHFPWTPYPGHFKEKGYNGLFLQDVSQCWVDDVEIQNSDFSLDLNSTNFCTASNVTLTTSADRGRPPKRVG